MAERMSAAAGAKPNTISPAEFASAVTEIARLKRAADEANGRYRNARKQLEDKGVNLKALALVERLRKLEDDEAESLMGATARYARWLGLPIGTQSSLWDDEQPMPEKARAELAEARAEQEGYEAGRNGRNGNDSGYPAGSPMHQRWYDGWCKGQALLAEGLGPKRRGRPPKEGAEAASAKPRGRRRGAASASTAH